VISRIAQRLAILLVAVTGSTACARFTARIHDVTTDTEDPPVFVDVLPLRTGARNSATYGGTRVAARQRASYPDIAPVDLVLTPAAAAAKALVVVSEMGWALVAADSTAGRIEATATTRVFRFKDDVVIRVRPRGDGSRIDVRSASRIGNSDLGKNAERIREFSRRLRALEKL